MAAKKKSARTSQTTPAARKRKSSPTTPARAPAQGAVKSVAQSLEHLEEAWRAPVIALRDAILRSDRKLREQLKWNAPSFGYDGDDRVTFRFAPRGGVQLILHRGSKVKDASSFAFDDTSGLVTWAAKDRGVVAFESPESLQAATPRVVKLVQAWMKATT
jgi:hypothetical protein